MVLRSPRPAAAEGVLDWPRDASCASQQPTPMSCDAPLVRPTLSSGNTSVRSHGFIRPHRSKVVSYDALEVVRGMPRGREEVSFPSLDRIDLTSDPLMPSRDLPFLSCSGKMCVQTGGAETAFGFSTHPELTVHDMSRRRRPLKVAASLFPLENDYLLQSASSSSTAPPQPLHRPVLPLPAAGSLHSKVSELLRQRIMFPSPYSSVIDTLSTTTQTKQVSRLEESTTTSKGSRRPVTCGSDAKKATTLSRLVFGVRSLLDEDRGRAVVVLNEAQQSRRSTTPTGLAGRCQSAPLRCAGVGAVLSRLESTAVSSSV